MGRCKSCTSQATEFGTTGVDGSWQDYRKNHHSAHHYKSGATAADVTIMWLVRIDPMHKRSHDNLVTDRAYVEGVDDDYEKRDGEWYCLLRSPWMPECGDLAHIYMSCTQCVCVCYLCADNIITRNIYLLNLNLNQTRAQTRTRYFGEFCCAACSLRVPR